MVDTKIDESHCSLPLDDKLLQKRPSKPLLDLQIGRKGIISRIEGGRQACKRLNELGLIPGVAIEMVNKINSGPVMIRVKGSKLAIGRGLASKVIVIIE